MRVCLLLLLMTARRVFFMIEQPFSSKLTMLPYVQHVFEMISGMLPVHNVFLSRPLRTMLYVQYTLVIKYVWVATQLFVSG